MMVGLQGAGKRQRLQNLQGNSNSKERNHFWLPATFIVRLRIQQLQVNGEKQGVEVFTMGDNHKPANIAKAAVEHAKKKTAIMW